MALMKFKTPVLNALCNTLKSSYPEIYLDGNNRDRPENRLVLPYIGVDRFQFYFSDKVENKAFRCAFALDLDQKDVERRKNYFNILTSKIDSIETIYGINVYVKENDAKLIKTHSSWIKVHKHRWYSIYLMHVCLDIRSEDPEIVANQLLPIVHFFVYHTCKLFAVIPIP